MHAGSHKPRPQGLSMCPPGSMRWRSCSPSNLRSGSLAAMMAALRRVTSLKSSSNQRTPLGPGACMLPAVSLSAGFGGGHLSYLATERNRMAAGMDRFALCDILAAPLQPYAQLHQASRPASCLIRIPTTFLMLCQDQTLAQKGGRPEQGACTWPIACRRTLLA